MGMLKVGSIGIPELICICIWIIDNGVRPLTPAYGYPLAFVVILLVAVVIAVFVFVFVFVFRVVFRLADAFRGVPALLGTLDIEGPILEERNLVRASRT
jgi:hypothetical protein